LLFERRPDTGWTVFAEAPAPAGATRFGDEVALRGTDLFASGSNESGTYLFRPTAVFGYQPAGNLQTVDGYMGGGRAYKFARYGEFLLQLVTSYDRGGIGVIHVYRQRADASYEHVAILAGRNGAALGPAVAISGQRVLVGGGGDGLVHSFELPASLSTPALQQDTFSSGNGPGWTRTAGSIFTAGTSGTSRVFRQASATTEARAVLDASDWTNQAIEADVRPRIFGAAGSGFGLATRYQGPQNFFDVVVRNSGVVQLRRMASGTLRILASAAFTPKTYHTYRLRLESIGTLHRVLIDGRLLLDFDSGGPTHGRAALYTDHVATDFDNVVVSPSLQATMYENNFNHGSTGPWTLSGFGYWNLWTGTSTVYNQSSVLGDARAAIGAVTDDQMVRVRARLDTFASPTGTQERFFGVMARYVDARNYYYLSLRSSNTVTLHKLVDGVITPLGSATFVVNPATWYVLRLDAVGDSLRAYVNGALLLEANDTSHPRGQSGPVTFKTAADFDDFAAYQP
jgi:hypothetical protein